MPGHHRSPRAPRHQGRHRRRTELLALSRLQVAQRGALAVGVVAAIAISAGVDKLTLGGADRTAASGATVNAPRDGGTHAGRSRRRPAPPPSPDLTQALLTYAGTPCVQISRGLYRTDARSEPTVPICDLGDAVTFTADLDVDCDGQLTDECNRDTDPTFLNGTSFEQSDGRPLDAAGVPYVVLPMKSEIWDFKDHGITGGSVVAVIYRDVMVYGVVGDTGPSRIVGEASYAAAEALGINPSGRVGGTTGPVTYVVFKNSRVPALEDTADVAQRGERLTRAVLAQ